MANEIYILNRTYVGDYEADELEINTGKYYLTFAEALKALRKWEDDEENVCPEDVTWEKNITETNQCVDDIMYVDGENEYLFSIVTFDRG